MHRVKVRVVEDALDANNTIASANRADFDREGVTVREPDERARARARRRCSSAALPGLDGVRAGRARGRRRRARSTPTGSPTCTSRSPSSTPTRASAASATSTRTWSARRCPSLPLAEIDLLVIENVGNLVCPAEFRVGEDARVMVSSVTEGEDKPLKYPLMFRACELVIVNKIDLLEHLDFDMEKFATTSTACTRACRGCSSARARARGSTRSATGSCALATRAGAPA